MALNTILQGNMAKLTITLTENGSAYPNLATADSVKLALAKFPDKTIALEVSDSSPNVVLDDGGTGIVSWQLTSPQTNSLDVGQYDLAVQVEVTSNILEWRETNSVEIKRQIISN